MSPASVAGDKNVWNKSFTSSRLLLGKEVLYFYQLRSELKCMKIALEKS
jgi:hypothetical protein